MEFEWDEAKAEANLQKHEISFQEAADIFKDLSAYFVEWQDERHTDEVRWNRVALLYGIEVHVTYTERDKVLRIISARRAAKRERERFWFGEI